MTDKSTGGVRRASGGGITGEHPITQTNIMLVAPAIEEEFNTIKASLIPVACWRVDDIRFEFGSSFIKPDVRDEFQDLYSLIKTHPDAPLSIFGHADPVGQDDSNKKLSGRRAQAVYAVLTRNTDLWEDLYKNPLGSDRWGKESLQIMLSALGYYQGPVHGKMDQETDDAVRRFQGDHGLEVDGDPGSQTRPVLYETYMDLICVDEEGSPYRLDPGSDFLGQGADAKGKGDYQGCSEFNPLLLFSQEEEGKFKKPENKEERNAENSPNRRVIVFLFAPGSVAHSETWPCPRAKEGGADCKKRFWSDGEERRNTHLQAQRRTFEDGKDTFACRFYHRMATNTPCEHIKFLLLIRVYDLEGKFIARAPFRVTIEDGKPILGRANDDGVVTIPVTKQTKRCFLEWNFEPKSTDEPDKYIFESRLFLNIDDQKQSEEEEAAQKLNNLGYPAEENLSENVASFQEDYGHLAEPPLEVTGQLDDRTKKLLIDVYRECEPDLMNTKVD